MNDGGYTTVWGCTYVLVDHHAAVLPDLHPDVLLVFVLVCFFGGGYDRVDYHTSINQTSHTHTQLPQAPIHVSQQTAPTSQPIFSELASRPPLYRHKSTARVPPSSNVKRTYSYSWCLLIYYIDGSFVWGPPWMMGRRSPPPS